MDFWTIGGLRDGDVDIFQVVQAYTLNLYIILLQGILLFLF